MESKSIQEFLTDVQAKIAREEPVNLQQCLQQAIAKDCIDRISTEEEEYNDEAKVVYLPSSQSGAGGFIAASQQEDKEESLVVRKTPSMEVPEGVQGMGAGGTSLNQKSKQVELINSLMR